MDEYNRVAYLLSYGLSIDEILKRTKLTRVKVNAIKLGLRRQFEQIESDGYTFTIGNKGEIVKVKV